MNSVRLDPFSAKLLAIRARGKSGPNPASRLSEDDGEDAVDTRVEASTASCCVDDNDDSEDDSDCDCGDDDDDDHDDGDNVATSASMLPVLDRVVVEATGCDTCGNHAGEGLPTMAQLMAEIRDLKARVQHLEERATPAG